MDGIRPHRTPDVEFSQKSEEDVADNAADFPVDAAMTTFEAIDAADECIGSAQHEAETPLPVLTEEEISAKSEKIKQLKNSSLCDPLDRVSDLAASFFIIAMEGTHASANELANALHDAFSSPLDGEKTAMVESFEIAMKKEKLSFIKTAFITEAYQPAASKVIDNYIRELVSRRDCIRLGAARAEYLLASGLGDEKHAEAVQSDMDALKRGTYHAQIEMRQALSIADCTCNAVDMLDQFEMMLRNSNRALPTLDTELQHLSLLADSWEDFVQKYAPRTLKNNENE
ncbi:hypothetical protein HC231_11920 [Brenneria izadpanahii]|uniref:Uncharacterized protein n=1 Tax=Brenneria izadpanahii TaxID=2722756 RepID=A0ABX7US96_9GAMM|nr:hypothetical protein [Brenneria izadpanahii]QTF08531.1 hypothetical protein HC231_11920 [Brenneria izadpanahii]